MLAALLGGLLVSRGASARALGAWTAGKRTERVLFIGTDAGMLATEALVYGPQGSLLPSRYRAEALFWNADADVLLYADATEIRSSYATYPYHSLLTDSQRAAARELLSGYDRLVVVALEDASLERSAVRDQLAFLAEQCGEMSIAILRGGDGMPLDSEDFPRVEKLLPAGIEVWQIPDLAYELYLREFSEIEGTWNPGDGINDDLEDLFRRKQNRNRDQIVAAVTAKLSP